MRRFLKIYGPSFDEAQGRRWGLVLERPEGDGKRTPDSSDRQRGRGFSQAMLAPRLD